MERERDVRRKRRRERRGEVERARWWPSSTWIEVWSWEIYPSLYLKTCFDLLFHVFNSCCMLIWVLVWELSEFEGFNDLVHRTCSLSMKLKLEWLALDFYAFGHVLWSFGAFFYVFWVVGEVGNRRRSKLIFAGKLRWCRYQGFGWYRYRYQLIRMKTLVLVPVPMFWLVPVPLRQATVCLILDSHNFVIRTLFGANNILKLMYWKSTF